MKKLTVIVPVYNAESTLHKCVDSIIGQEYSNLEIILIDDGSSDGSLMICNDYAQRDSRIIVYHKKNEGLVAARKDGVRLATGEYIGFVDSDDFVDGNMYSSLMNEANQNGADIVIGGIIIDYPDRSVKFLNRLPAGYYDKDDIKKKIIPEMLMRAGFYKNGIVYGVVVKVFKKEVIKETLKYIGNSLTMGEDVAITSYSMVNADSVSIIESCAYHYVQTETSMIRGYNPKRFDAICNMYECIEKIEEPEYKKHLGATFACILYGVLSDCIRNGEFTRKEAREKVRELLSNELSVRALASADASKWPFADKIKLILMKHKCIGVLTAILSR